MGFRGRRRSAGLTANAIIDPPSHEVRASEARWRPPAGWQSLGSGIFVPPDYVPNDYELPTPLIDPTNLRQRAEETERCADDAAYFATHYCWALHVDDPEFPQWRKFPAYPYLITFLRDMQQPTNTHVDK